MTTIVLVIHLLLALAMCGIILLQRSEGGALGMGGGGSGGGLMTARGTANLLTRATAILATCFICTSLLLAILAARGGGESSILSVDPVAPAGQENSEPAEPTVPLAN